MGTSINSFFGRIAAPSVSERVAFGGAYIPHVPGYIPVSCAPGALHFIPKI